MNPEKHITFTWFVKTFVPPCLAISVVVDNINATRVRMDKYIPRDTLPLPYSGKTIGLIVISEIVRIMVLGTTIDNIQTGDYTGAFNSFLVFAIVGLVGERFEKNAKQVFNEKLSLLLKHQIKQTP